ncbi:MAG: SH3 domain-containing protein, partial [Clostridia bacterium]
MNKIKKVSVATIVGLAIFGTTVFASTGKVYNTSQGLVLRGAASKTGAPLTTVPNDKEFEILEDLGEWYKVNVDGKEGYLFAEYVKVIEETPAVELPKEEEPETNDPVKNTNLNTTKTETKIYKLPLITSSNIGIIPANTELKIEKTLNNWAYVSYNNVNGWIRTYNYNTETVETPKPENVPEEPEETPVETPEATPPTQPTENTDLSFTKGYINSSSVNVRKGPSTDTEIVTTLILNTGVTITAQTDEWYKITYGDYNGYIYKPLISETPTVTNRGNEVRQPETTEEQTPIENNEQTTDSTTNNDVATVPSNSTAGEKIVSFAKQYLGYRYVYGGTKPSTGFDCSGFVYYVFNSCGYNISRSLSAQANTGVAVSKAELQPG